MNEDLERSTAEVVDSYLTQEARKREKQVSLLKTVGSYARFKFDRGLIL